MVRLPQQEVESMAVHIKVISNNVFVDPLSFGIISIGQVILTTTSHRVTIRILRNISRFSTNTVPLVILISKAGLDRQVLNRFYFQESLTVKTAVFLL